jgi:uncharacterized protein YceH (UPF0502 family)
VTRLPRRPGEKGERYAQLLGEGASPPQEQGQSSGLSLQEEEPSLEERVSILEEEVARLRDELAGR